MQNKVWIGAVVALVVVAGVAFYFFGGKGGLATLGNSSLRDLLSANISQKCTFDNAQSNGTIYVGAGKMRGDFMAKNSEVTAQSHMIISNNIAYVWIEGMAQGYYMPFDENLTANGGAQSNQGIDADAKVATHCEPWQASESSFTLPTNITFSAVGAIPTTGTTPSTATSSSSKNTTPTSSGANASAGAGANVSYHAQQCAACAMVKDATQHAQCKAAFDCEQ